MRWKHYFYFTQGEKLAIVILLILIIVAGGAYIYIGKERTKGNVQDNIHQQEFERFVAQLKDKQSKPPPKYNKKTYPGNTYQRQEKLSEGKTIELNTADTSALKQIPGIGSGYASRIVKYRSLLGGYATISQLKEVWGMDDYLYAKIIPYIELTDKHQRIKVNSADFKELNKHPYISYKQAQVIVDIRERKGNIESIERLSLLEEFEEKDIIRLRSYLSFD